MGFGPRASLGNDYGTLETIMNKLNAHLYSPHLQALSEGELQVNRGTQDAPNWGDPSDDGEFVFSLPPAFYRRRPAPLECWVTIYPAGVANCYPDRGSAETAARNGGATRVAKFVEALE